MEVSKINNVLFKCLHDKNGFNVKPNNAHVKHKNKTALILLGLAATGAIGAAVLYKKNKLPKLNISEKLSSLNIKKAQASQTSVETVVNAKEKLEANQPVAEATSTLFDEMQAVNANPPAARIVEKQQEAVVPKRTPRRLRRTEKLEQEAIIPVPEEKVEKLEQKAVNPIQETKIETKAENKVESEVENKAKTKIENQIEAKEKAQEKVEEKVQEQVQEKPIEKFVDKYTEQERLEFAEANRPYLEFVINDSKQFKDFGVDQRFVEALETVDPKMVQEMDDKFLSILLGPIDKMSIDFYEAMKPRRVPNKVLGIAEQTILKNTKKAQKQRISDKRIEIFNIIPSFASEKARIGKIKELDSTFTVDEIQKIFSDDNPQKRYDLLCWLTEFKTTKREEQLLKSLKA